MYKKCYASRIKNNKYKIHLWDDIGYDEIVWYDTAYEQNKDGKYTGVDGVKLSKTTKVFSGIQTVYGEISLDIYSRGRDMQKTGIIGNRINLTSESTLMRAAYCLSQKEKPFEEIWNENLEGFKIRSEDIEEN